MQELVWQVANGVDFEGGKVPLNQKTINYYYYYFEGGKVPLNQRFPFLELDTCWTGYMSTTILKKSVSKIIYLHLVLFRCLFSVGGWFDTLRLSQPSSWLGYNNTKEALDDMPTNRPRFIKSHLPLSMLPPNLMTKAKVVYMARNPKDCMVSYYHHHKLITGHGYVGDLPNFARRFMRNELMYGSIFPHAKEAWALKDNPNMLFVFYEDMKADLMKVIERVCKFLDRPLTLEKKEMLANHLHIDNFRNNNAVNPTSMFKNLGLFVGDGNFIREGRVSAITYFPGT